MSNVLRIVEGPDGYQAGVADIHDAAPLGYSSELNFKKVRHIDSRNGTGPADPYHWQNIPGATVTTTGLLPLGAGYAYSAPVQVVTLPSACPSVVDVVSLVVCFVMGFLLAKVGSGWISMRTARAFWSQRAQIRRLRRESEELAGELARKGPTR